MDDTSTHSGSIQNDGNQDADSRFRIFVYGSLKKGYALHHLLESQIRLADASTRPVYRLFDLGEYPGLIEWPDGIEIFGEVYEISLACLQRLDEAEGVEDGLYARRQIQLQAQGDRLPVYAWFWLGSIGGLRNCGSSWP
jgi:gamma-glutamylaminecyclotransferase